jgi:predicted acetyltransferase
VAEEDELPVSSAVSLERAGPDAAPLLSNLLELYIHDMSEVFPVKLGRDGRFGYERLSLYWTDQEARLAFLIRYGGEIAGFALVTRGSPVTTDPTDLDVAEFFVLRSYRRSGVGRQAARQLWDSVPGNWVVRVSDANRAGLRFWEEVVRDYTSGRCIESVRSGSPYGWRVFRFATWPDGTKRDLRGVQHR